MARIVGIGAYPQDKYFDPQRPSWLPYWIDTPTESDMKYGGANLIEDTVNAASMATGTVVGATANAAGQIGANAGKGLLGSLDISGYLLLGVLGFVAYGYLRR